jgi:hypothetical protein
MIRAIDGGAASWRARAGHAASRFRARVHGAPPAERFRLAYAAAQRLGGPTALVDLLFKTLAAQGAAEDGTQALVKALEALAAKAPKVG